MPKAYTYTDGAYYIQLLDRDTVDETYEIRDWLFVDVCGRVRIYVVGIEIIGGHSLEKALLTIAEEAKFTLVGP